MNSLITASILVTLTGSVFVSQNAIAAPNSAAQENAGEGLIKIRGDYLKNVQNIVKNYKNRLEKLNKTKGSDVEIYKQIVTVDAVLDKADAAIKNLMSVTTMVSYLKGRITLPVTFLADNILSPFQEVEDCLNSVS